MLKTLADNLRELHAGQPLPAEYINAFVRACRIPNGTHMQTGVAGEGIHASAYKQTIMRPEVQCTTGADIPAYSIFGITEGDVFDNPCELIVEQFDLEANVNLLGFFTNAEVEIPEDTTGPGYAIGYWDPVLLQVTGELPEPGWPCGPQWGTWGVSNTRYGLLCLSLPDENDRVWCIRTPDPHAVIGLLQDDVAPFDPSTDTVSEGVVQLKYRDDDNVLQPALDPAGDPFELPVFNISASSYKTGSIVQAIMVMGVGLVLVDAKSLLWGRASANIPHYETGKVTLYSGVPGAEGSIGKQVSAFNQLSEVVEDEWVFLVPTGDTETPYYILQNEYRGKILGKTTGDVEENDTVTVQIYTGVPGSESEVGTEIKAFVGQFFGAIPKNTWVQCIHLATAEDEVGGWYVTCAQRGNSLPAYVKVGSADPNNGYCAIDTMAWVTLQYGPGGDTKDSGIEVLAACIYQPVFDDELVHVEWNGDAFVITQMEFVSGLYCTVSADIPKGSTGIVSTGVQANSKVNISSLRVNNPLGLVSNGKKVFVLRNRGGCNIVSGEC